MKKFDLGRVVMTRGVNDLIAESVQAAKDSIVALRRHIVGDWGDLDAHDKRVNEEALKHGDRILSAYKLDGHKVWVITEADRSATTIMFPNEY